MKEIYDVAVIGGGPAGAAAAKHCVNAGMKTLVIERKYPPREKLCAGLLSPLATRYINRHFGIIPLSVYADPQFLDSVVLYADSLSEPLQMPYQSPTANIRRDQLDYFLLQSSGAKIATGRNFVSFFEDENKYRLKCIFKKSNGRSSSETFICRYVIAADGVNSQVARLFSPLSMEHCPVLINLKVSIQGSIDLDHRCFHTFLWRDVGVNAWVLFKDGLINLVCGSNLYFQPQFYLSRFIKRLRTEMNLQIQEEVGRNSISGALAAPFGRFFLGRGRLLTVGDAAGFMHINEALHSGLAAARAVKEAEQSGGDLIQIYRETVYPEIKACMEQFNPLKMGKANPFPVKGAAFKALPPLKRLKFMKDMFSYLNQDFAFAGCGLGRQMLLNMMKYLISGGYEYST